MTNSDQPGSTRSTIGTFSKAELEDYMLEKGITSEELETSSTTTASTFSLIERVAGCYLDARVRYLMESFGLGVGAFLVPELDWELVAILEKEERYLMRLIELDENELLISFLTPGERHALHLFANAYRITYKHFACNIKSAKATFPLSKYKAIPTKNQ